MSSAKLNLCSQIQYNDTTIQILEKERMIKEFVDMRTQNMLSLFVVYLSKCTRSHYNFYYDLDGDEDCYHFICFKKFHSIVQIQIKTYKLRSTLIFTKMYTIHI